MQSNITKSAMLNGLWIGLLLSLKFLLSTQKSNTLGFISLFISVSIIFVLYRMAQSFRDKELNGVIEYNKAFSFIFQLYFYGAMISSLVMLIYTAYLNPTYLDFYLSETMKMYKLIKFPVDDNSYNLLEKIFKPAPFALGNLFSSAIAGVFWGLILAAFVKKEKNIF